MTDFFSHDWPSSVTSMTFIIFTREVVLDCVFVRKMCSDTVTSSKFHVVEPHDLDVGWSAFVEAFPHWLQCFLVALNQLVIAFGTTGSVFCELIPETNRR